MHRCGKNKILYTKHCSQSDEKGKRILENRSVLLLQGFRVGNGKYETKKVKVRLLLSYKGAEDAAVVGFRFVGESV